MADEKKIVLGTNVVLEIATIIFIIFLKRYGRELLLIQSRYESKLEQAWNVIKDPRYLYYFGGGILFATLLVATSVWDFKKVYDCGVMSIMLIMFNIIVFISLGIAFWNPVFTAFLTCLVALGVANAVLGT